MGGMMQEDSTKRRDRAQGGQYKKRGGGGRIMQKDITEGRDGAEGGYYKRERWCRRTL